MTAKLVTSFNESGVDYTDPSNRTLFFSNADRDTFDSLKSRERPPFGNPAASCDTNLFFGFFTTAPATTTAPRSRQRTIRRAASQVSSKCAGTQSV